jgi:predicted nucleotide-binding protein (sugar kinase/HSP70/actin superfamily)
MTVKVGIPRALLYYDYFPLWQGFFQSLGAEVVVSDVTCKRTLEKGLSATVDDACLPVKVYFGHVLDLKDEVDYIFVPRIVSVEEKAYICPKFMGLPDMARDLIGEARLIDTCIDMSKGRGLVDAVLTTGRYFTPNPLRIWEAFLKGWYKLGKYRGDVQRGSLPDRTPWKGKEPDLTVALLGHPYNIYDPYITMDLIGVLRSMGVKVLTPEMVHPAFLEREVNRIVRKPLFWSLGRRILGAAGYFETCGQVNGIIHVASFGCGPDSLVGELVARRLRRSARLPFMELSIDEHSGQAGVITRLEAFVDMIKWRNQGI